MWIACISPQGLYLSQEPSLRIELSCVARWAQITVTCPPVRPKPMNHPWTALCCLLHSSHSLGGPSPCSTQAVTLAIRDLSTLNAAFQKHIRKRSTIPTGESILALYISWVRSSIFLNPPSLLTTPSHKWPIAIHTFSEAPGKQCQSSVHWERCPQHTSEPEQSM